ncbi:hypothetical protein L7F22_005717 [Adiantum nelumboides]|nr:hypothetical protein [Adiantum nelumboides]
MPECQFHYRNTLRQYRQKHRHCDNTFINGNSGEVKIGDLGLAVILSQAPAAHSVIGTPEFMAPEFYEEHYNELVDIYSFGMCLLELITLDYPYSECMNAAQVYKRVTSGRKPEALNKVKNLEMRKLVEKCLTSASERLHAKELLMDQFLQRDKHQGVLDSHQPTILDPYNDLRDLYPLLKGSNLQLASQSEDGGGGVDVCLEKVTAEGSAGQSSPLPSKDHGLDFQPRALRQKSREELKLESKMTRRFLSGGVRYIQFDFELETDTAIDVANEMVTELDLIDQDPTVIAGMIDAELMALLPDWKPGPCCEEAEFSEAVAMQQELMTSDGEGPNKLDILPAFESAGAPCSMNGTLVHGRFEEVGVNLSGSHHARQEAEGICFSDFSSEQFEGGGSDLSLDASFDRLNAETCSNDLLALQRMEEVVTDIRLETSVSTREHGLSSFEGGLIMHKFDGDDYSEELGLLMLQQKNEIRSPFSEGQLSQEADNIAEQSNERSEICQDADTEVAKALPKTSKDRFESTTCKSMLKGPHELVDTSNVLVRTQLNEVCLDAYLQPETSFDHDLKVQIEEAMLIRHQELLDASNVLVRTELSKELCLDAYLQSETSFDHDLKAQIMAGYCNIVCEDSDKDRGTLDGVTLDTEKETKVGRLDSLTLVEMGIAPSRESSASKGFTSSHELQVSTEPRWLHTSTQEQDFITKRQSSFEYYKAASFQKEKVLPEQHGARENSFESLDAKLDKMEQLKKLQLKKSISDLEAKTLQCFSQSSSYKAKRVGKTPIASIPSGQPASLGRH